MIKIWFETLFANSGLWVPKISAAVAVFLLFYILAQIAKRLITRGADRFDLDANLTILLSRASRITLIVLGLITALGTLGINVSALVAGLGLSGFALGFALKDTIANLLSGVLILLYRPFVIGDHIKIAGFEGKVVSIDLRYTELDGKDVRILVPNSKSFTDPIVVKDQK